MRAYKPQGHESKGSICPDNPHQNGTMFGMQDPSQTLVQIERYIEGGRLELSEVMATQFCDHMMAVKKRDAQQQIHLLKGLRLLCDVCILRQKPQQGLPAAKRMHKERKKLVKLLKKHAPQLLGSMRPEHEDHLRAGRIFAAAGKDGAAKKSFARCEDLATGHLQAACLAASTVPSTQHVKRLLSAVEAAGPVIRTGGVFVLEPNNSPAVALPEVIEALNSGANGFPEFAEACQTKSNGLSAQREAIISGEQAANAQLQSALDSLQPKHDYYQYG